MTTIGAGPATNGTTHNPLVHDYPKPLKIAIVGAGIGGLSAAIALRRQGHDIQIFEQSRFANETGAAVHLAPNSNGLLRRWGIFAEKFGGTVMNDLIEYTDSGSLVKEIDFTGPNSMWQHPWHLVHRVALHENLKEAATGQGGPGTPPTLQTSSKVVDVDAEAGKIIFADGQSAEYDLIIGADGIYSKTRKAIDGGASKLFGSGKAAFRFLIPRKTALADPETKAIAEKPNTLVMWYGADRRIVMYPCNDNETLNFVLIHPDTESHATKGDEWSRQGDVEHVLKVYQDFDPRIKKLIAKADPAELKVWQLLDMDKLPTWTKGKLALIGDAAHPFTPHQGQGAGQAMEDAAALATVLPTGTAPCDVPERLKLYEKIRYDRGHRIQEYSRQAGKDWIDGKPQIDMMSYTAYNFGHDEIDNSANVFKRWLWSQKKDMYWRMPIGYGPFPGPRQDHLGRIRGGYDKQTFVTASIKFKTSRTYLETLFPTAQFTFASPATVCTASISITTLDKMLWLGGKGYNHCGLYIHGVKYTKRDGTALVGTHLSVLFESLTDPIVSGRDELGMNKIFCDIDIDRTDKSYRAQCSWKGAKFLDFELDDLNTDASHSEQGTIGGESDYGILTYKYIPAVGERGKADAEYACVVPHAEESKYAPSTVHAVARSSKPSIKFDAGDWDSLPTLHHVAQGLAEIPIYEIISAKVVEGNGVPDVSACRRIE